MANKSFQRTVKKLRFLPLAEFVRPPSDRKTSLAS